MSNFTGLLALFSLLTSGYSLNCFHCDSYYNRDCGFNLNNDNFLLNCGDRAIVGTGETICGMQIQDQDSDEVRGVLRACYERGSLPGLDDSNGCRQWTNPGTSYTAIYCFCDTDACNRNVGDLLLTNPE